MLCNQMRIHIACVPAPNVCSLCDILHQYHLTRRQGYYERHILHGCICNDRHVHCMNHHMEWVLIK